MFGFFKKKRPYCECGNINEENLKVVHRGVSVFDPDYFQCNCKKIVEHNRLANLFNNRSKDYMDAQIASEKEYYKKINYPC